MIRPVPLACLLAAVAPSPAAAAWSETTTVPGSKEAVISRVAYARNGTVGVTWGDAKVAVRKPGGWRGARSLATPGTSAAMGDTAFDADGNLLVAWTQSPARPGTPLRGPYTIRVVNWNPRRGWGSVRVLGRSRNFHLAQPRIATNSRGDAAVSWRGFRRSGRRVVEALAASTRIAGERFGPTRYASVGGPYRDVALDLRGNAYGVVTTYKGPVNHFVYMRRGRGWGKSERLPGTPASKPRIAVAADRSAVVAWRGAGVDSEGDGIQAGPASAVLRSSTASWTFPFALSPVRASDVNVIAVGGGYLVTWAAGFENPALPGSQDLHYALRGEGNYIGGDVIVPGARLGPSAPLDDGTMLVVYGADDGVRVIRWNRREWKFGPSELVGAGGLYPALADNGREAVATYLDRRRMRLKVRRITG